MDAKSAPPGELRTTYKQYKEDTESIAGWLAENAIKCGFKLADAATPTSGPRLKGKARKQAREAMKDGTKRSSCTVKVAELLNMAITIANFKPRPNIPQALGRLFDRAIGARRECNEWYQKHDHGDYLSNQRHSHFINILIATWETLRPFQSSNKKWTGVKPNAKNSKHGNALSFLNRFSNLQVHDTMSSDPDAADEHVQDDTASGAQHEPDDFKLPGITPAAIEKDEEDIEADFFFAIYSFLCEIGNLRYWVRKFWSHYASGEMELTVASLLANTAIQLVRRAEQALDLLIQRPKRYPASKFPVWTFPALFMYMQHQNNPMIRAIPIHDFVLISPTTVWLKCEHADFCLWPVYNAVKCTVSAVESLCKGPFDGGTWLLHPPDFDKNRCETFERIQKLLPGFQVTALKFENSFADDEISRGILEILGSFTLPVWAVFGIQVLLDMQDVLQGASSRQPLEELQSHTRDVLKTTDFFDHANNSFGRVSKCRAVLPDWLKERLEDFKEITLDNGARHHVRKMLIIDGYSDRDIENLDYMQEEDFFLSKHPLRCGLLKYYLYFQLHEGGVWSEGELHILGALIHIYAACRCLYPDDPVWPDMELFLHNQDVDHLFVGGIPKSMDEALRKLMLAFGVPPQSSKSSKKVPKLRVVSDPNPLKDVLKDWILGDEKANNAGDWLLKLMAASYNPKWFMERAQRSDQGAAAESIMAQWSNAGADPVQFLQVLSCYLMTDTDLYFNWLQMHLFCEIIWSDIKTHIYNETGERYDLPWIVALEVLGQANDTEKLAKRRGIDTVSFLRNNAHRLNTAWGSIQRLCAEGRGDSCIEDIVEKTSKDPFYPTIYVAKQLDKLYKNWPEERRKKSSTYMSLSKIQTESMEPSDEEGKEEDTNEENTI